MRQKSNASEDFNFAVEHEDVVSKVVVLKKQARKHRSDSKPNGIDKATDVSVKWP